MAEFSSAPLPKMYEIQTLAYNVSHYEKTDSTPDTPPSCNVDPVKACKVKTQLIANLPTKCGHCQQKLNPGVIIERNPGDIVAYCKAKDCGRSQVLFSAIPERIPLYIKVCPFIRAPTAPITFQNQEMEVRSMLERNVIAKPYDPRFPEGNPKDHEMCIQCDKPFREHEQGSIDTNGWKISGWQNVILPPDWPTWNDRTKTWVIR